MFTQDHLFNARSAVINEVPTSKKYFKSLYLKDEN